MPGDDLLGKKVRLKTVVVNIYKEPYDEYIGRPGKGQDGTFGNPFRSDDREEMIRLYREYFYKRIDDDEEFKCKVLELKGKRLGCFCSNGKPCHGQIIADYLNSIPDEPVQQYEPVEDVRIEDLG